MQLSTAAVVAVVAVVVPAPAAAAVGGAVPVDGTTATTQQTITNQP